MPLPLFTSQLHSMSLFRVTHLQCVHEASLSKWILQNIGRYVCEPLATAEIKSLMLENTPVPMNSNFLLQLWSLLWSRYMIYETSIPLFFWVIQKIGKYIGLHILWRLVCLEDLNYTFYIASAALVSLLAHTCEQ